MEIGVEEILALFEQINKMPRCSKAEGAVSAWLQSWGLRRGFATRTDHVGNVVISVPASQGFEGAPLLVLQAHMDMVCQKRPGSRHDFSKDPIEHVRDGDWLRANGTTLGADNGIGVALALALALALAETHGSGHPPFELLFTVDEETGLTGACALEAGFIEAKTLLNLDSEEEGVFTVGCAGGRDTRIELPVQFDPAAGHWDRWILSATGMRGGHSGIDIQKNRANALRILARSLDTLRRVVDLRLVAVEGGTAHNAIAREAEAVLACAPERRSLVQQTVGAFRKTVREEYDAVEPSMDVRIARAQKGAHVAPMTGPSTETVINFLLAMPHGVAGMCTGIPSLVETSNNLAVVRTTDASLVVVSSQRSSVASRLSEITAGIEALAALAGAHTSTGVGYPGWRPNLESPLLARCKGVYQALFGQEPHVQAVHAGLECGVIGSKYPGMDMISLGPTIENAHSPDERLHIASVSRTWDFLLQLLKSFGAH